jgi:hypothetical protein
MGGLGSPPDAASTSGSVKMLYHENSSQMRLNRGLSARRPSELRLSDEDTAKQTCRGTLLGDQDGAREVKLPLPKEPMVADTGTEGYKVGNG